MSALNTLLLGAIATASLVVALFFLRFWHRTRDRFFILFSLSFAVEAVNRVALALYWTSETDNPIYFLIRFVAYAIIIGAIIDKNVTRKSPR